ncbi:uncharacterized protein METZ01_LOCUS298969 [marine metagenome]|uniref:Uncharacterized protein n=1 Tax=marine metagenome TaxID=408172 RepID=A0A382MDI1_9ZZZZ
MKNNESKPFRDLASFGKRMEYKIIAEMLLEDLDIYLPLVDDDAIDAVVKKPDGSFVEVQIKARSEGVQFGTAALFAAISHRPRKNYWFIFYSESMEKKWTLSSKEFIKESSQNKKPAKNEGKRTIWFNGKNTKTKKEHVKPQFEKYLTTSFDRIKNENPDT